MSQLNSTYRILPDKNLVIEYHSGVLKVEDYIEFKKKLHTDPLFKADLKHFIHHKNVVFNTKPADIVHFTKYINSVAELLGNRKVALVTDTPNQVVSTTMYKMMQKNPTQTVDVFSTLESGLNWLDVDEFYLDELMNIILELSKQ